MKYFKSCFSSELSYWMLLFSLKSLMSDLVEQGSGFCNCYFAWSHVCKCRDLSVLRNKYDPVYIYIHIFLSFVTAKLVIDPNRDSDTCSSRHFHGLFPREAGGIWKQLDLHSLQKCSYKECFGCQLLLNCCWISAQHAAESCFHGYFRLLADPRLYPSKNCGPHPQERWGTEHSLAFISADLVQGRIFCSRRGRCTDDTFYCKHLGSLLLA